MPEMKEHPILFSSEMVRAILEGRKTQTRRIVKYIPLLGYARDWCPKVDYPEFKAIVGDYSVYCPYGKTGDRLWVRETFCKTDSGYEYRADVKPKDKEETARIMKDYGYVWKPSRHMPRKASRIALEIVSVRVERLQEISEADCYAEGIDLLGAFAITENLAKRLYRELWNSINGKKAGCDWNSDPFVWVLEFRRLTDGME